MHNLLKYKFFWPAQDPWTITQTAQLHDVANGFTDSTNHSNNTTQNTAALIAALYLEDFH